jgi:fatty acid desaturase
MDSLLFKAHRLEEITEVSPFVVISRIILQHLIGFLWYLLTSITVSSGSLHQERSYSFLGNSHFRPTDTLFRAEEASLVIISDLGITAMTGILWYCSSAFGIPVMLPYVQPYLWLKDWIVAITHLHHTHPDLPKYDDEAWTFLRGANATICCNGRCLFHGIVEYHVIDHLFS